jgi:hypothetical protein
MKSGTEMKRTNAIRKQQEEHHADDPFCAVHPDFAARPSRIMQSEPEPRIPLRHVEPSSLRAHVKAEHVIIARKKK